jgi:hypothetical protein
MHELILFTCSTKTLLTQVMVLLAEAAIINYHSEHHSSGDVYVQSNGSGLLNV